MRHLWNLKLFAVRVRGARGGHLEPRDLRRARGGHVIHVGRAVRDPWVAERDVPRVRL